jgi:hypothetical protein
VSELEKIIFTQRFTEEGTEIHRGLFGSLEVDNRKVFTQRFTEEGTEIHRGFYWGREILEVIYTEIHGVGTEIHRGFYGGG